MAIETLIEAIGGHSSGALGLDLATVGDRARWLFAARLESERDSPETVRAAFARLTAGIGADPESLAAADPQRVAALLAEVGLRRSESVAAGLCRAARAIQDRHGGDLEGLAAGCDGLEELGATLAALAPGFGRATVLRFLRPLRSVWSAARETPLAEPALAAARHLGLLGDGDDLDGEPARLRRALEECAPGIAFADAEAALERLGALACRSGKTARCPLREACPARGEAAEFR